MRFVVFGSLLLSGCLFGEPRVYVTPLASYPPPLGTGCPVTVTTGTPAAGQHITAIAVGHCVHAHGSGDACEALLRDAACRLGANYIFGLHPESDGQAGTIALYEPSRTTNEGPKP